MPMLALRSMPMKPTIIAWCGGCLALYGVNKALVAQTFAGQNPLGCVGVIVGVLMMALAMDWEARRWG